MTKGVPGIPLAAMAAGAVLVWSGIQNVSIQATLTSLLKGVAPTAGPAQQLVSASGSTGTTAATAAAGDTGASTATASANQAIARLLTAPYGWSTGTEWADLVSLWNKESGWSNTAQNPSSTAYGIAQFLDTTWAPYGPKTSDPMLQIKYGLEYIKDRYGSPSAAWAHETSAGWY